MSEYNPRENFAKIKGHEHVCRNLYWYSDYCKYLEEQNEQMLDALIVWYKFSSSLSKEKDGTITSTEDWLCLATNNSITKEIIEQIAGKKIEEVLE